MRVALLLTFFLLFSQIASAQNRSVYTSFGDKACRTLELTEEEGGSYLGECPGVAGYKLHLLEGDLRQSIDVITPRGRKHELKFWEQFGGFSHVGPRAEWRLKAGRPVGLIIRYDVSQPDDSTKEDSYLLVAKIGETEACVTDVVPPGRSQNIEARRLADTAWSRKCKAAR
jgi:hypothetical protein